MLRRLVLGATVTGALVLGVIGPIPVGAAAGQGVGTPQQTTVAVPDHVSATAKVKRTARAKSNRKSAKLLRKVNNARSRARTCGSRNYPAAKPLKANGKLETAAYRYARDMARHDRFDHTGRDGSSPTDRARAVGYPRGVGENIAAGYGSVKAVMAGWLASDGHCANIMSQQHKHLGSGYSTSSSSTYGSYWVQDFGTR